MKHVTRKSAIAEGLTRYFTGKPCKAWHIAERFTTPGRCVVCSLLQCAHWRRKRGIRERQTLAKVSGGQRNFIGSHPCPRCGTSERSLIHSQRGERSRCVVCKVSQDERRRRKLGMKRYVPTAPRPIKLRPTLAERIATKIMPVTESGCWIWIGDATQDGYGRLSIKGKFQLMHRYMWKQVHGAIPKGLCVCHRCDTPSCVNPVHLFLGTRKANTRDMMDKRRWAACARKLTAVDVSEIRCWLKHGLSPRIIEHHYNISGVHVRRIRSESRWRSVPMARQPAGELAYA